MDLRVSDLIERNRNIFVKFKYHDINYSGLIFKVIQDGKKRNYALYIDVSLIQRLTRIRHLKKIENLDGQLLNEKDIEDKVGIIYSDHDDLFNYEAREFIDPYKNSLNKIIEDLEKKRDQDFNSFKLENFI